MRAIPRAGRRRLVTAGVVAVASLALAACSSSPATSPTGKAASNVTIGFSPYNQSSPALVGSWHGVQGVGKSLNVSTVVADPNNSPTKQAEQIRSWLELGQVQGIWTLALNPSTIKPLLALAKSKNVALLTSGTYQQFGLKSPPVNVSFDAIDYTDFGKQMGEQLGKCANERLGGKGQFLYLTYSAGQVGKTEQDAAVAAALKSVSPGSQIVATTTYENSQLTAQQNTLSAIQAHPGLNGSVGGTDEATLGPLTAFTQANKNPLQQCIIGGGGNDAALAAVKARTIYSDTTIQFEADLQHAVTEVVKMTKHLGDKGIQMSVPILTVTK